MRLRIVLFPGVINRGHNRQEHIFQNRYKSTVCEEERNEELHWTIFVPVTKNVTSIQVTVL